MSHFVEIELEMTGDPEDVVRALLAAAEARQTLRGGDEAQMDRTTAGGTGMSDSGELEDLRSARCALDACHTRLEQADKKIQELTADLEKARAVGRQMAEIAGSRSQGLQEAHGDIAAMARAFLVTLRTLYRPTTIQSASPERGGQA